MTTVAPNDSTIRRSDPIRTRASSARPAQEQDWSQWEAWMEGHKKLLGEEVVEAIAQHLTDPLEKRIRTLENELALANGKLAILSGKGVPGTFNIKGTFDARSIYNYLDVVAYNGASWVATRDNPGHELPGPGWQLLEPRVARSAGRAGRARSRWRSSETRRRTIQPSRHGNLDQHRRRDLAL
jgi:hypothetical protein